MANTIFEKQGGTYTQVGDYMLPDLLPAEEETVRIVENNWDFALKDWGYEL